MKSSVALLLVLFVAFSSPSQARAQEPAIMLANLCDEDRSCRIIAADSIRGHDFQLLVLDVQERTASGRPGSNFELEGDDGYRTLRLPGYNGRIVRDKYRSHLVSFYDAPAADSIHDQLSALIRQLTERSSALADTLAMVRQRAERERRELEGRLDALILRIVDLEGSVQSTDRRGR